MYYFNFDYESPERYDMAKYMEALEGTYDPLTSYFIDALLKLPIAGAFTVTSELYRPDLVSYRVYGTTLYWWIIMVYNNILLPWEIVIGKEITYPSIPDIEDLYFSLKAKGLKEE